MSLGKRTPKQSDLFVPHQDLPTSPGHPFYKALNRVLAESHFDDQVDALCSSFYREGGRPSIPAGVYFRMLLVGFFEGIDSQRGIAWRCADSLSLRDFLGLSMTDAIPDHSSLTRWRQRLSLEVHQEVFEIVLSIASEKKILKGRTVGIDSTTLEANAAMKSIVRKRGGDSYKKYLKRLAEKEGIEDPNDEDLRRFDRRRRGKKVSNDDWKSPTDPDSRITRMKDGRTRLGYKAEHAVDLESDLIIAAEIYHADEMDVTTLTETVSRAQWNLRGVPGRHRIEEIAADKGYHSTQNLVELEEVSVRSYIPQKIGRRRWRGREEQERLAVQSNRRRIRTKKGKLLQHRRSEMTERSFMQVCTHGGARRSWIRGREEIAKRYAIQAAARNLAVIMRRIFGIGTPRTLLGRIVAEISFLFDFIVRITLRVRRDAAITDRECNVISTRFELEPVATIPAS